MLNEQDFALFSRLRAERRRVAEADGVPVYTVFSNAQLAEMVRARVTNESAMADVGGVGKARVEKYAATFLPILAAAFADAPDQKTGSSS